MTIYYKGMLENGLTRYEREGWELPKGNRPGKWMPKTTPVLCASGYHVCTIDQLREWIAPAIYIVEVRGAHVQDSSKSAWEQARLVRRIEGWGMAEMVAWAQACTERVAHLKNADAAAAARYAAASASAAAGYAAADAGYAAGYAAADAADAAGYAAGYAAAAAAAAEKRWQTELLASMLGIDYATSTL